MKKLINRPENLIQEQLNGIIAAHSSLHVCNEPRYVWRTPHPDHVALISGGGNGHEPMHVGFIGEGMLTAACPGEIFTSPTPDQMYECAKQVDTGNGVLFLVKNHTGDILNFETAVELLHNDGMKVAMVVIDDDISVKDSMYTAGRRGVAATVMIEKIVGAAIEQGYDLARCEALAQQLNNNARTLGVALNSCTVPAVGRPSFILAENEVEFGVGIHGEQGVERRTYTNVKQLVTDVFKEIIDCPDYTRKLTRWDRETQLWAIDSSTTDTFHPETPYIIMVNGLGGSPLSELYGVFHELAQCCKSAGITLARNLVGNYCTALDMQGFSITLLQANDEILQLWDAPVNAPSVRWGC